MIEGDFIHLTVQNEQMETTGDVITWFSKFKIIFPLFAFPKSHVTRSISLTSYANESAKVSTVDFVSHLLNRRELTSY